MEKHFFLALVVILCHLALSSAIAGTATFYTPPYQPSSCYEYEDMGTMIAAASDVIWDDRAACGRNYRVTCTGATNADTNACTGASVVVKIVDYCPPGGCRGTIDLSQEAFAVIGDLNAGIIKINYTLV